MVIYKHQKPINLIGIMEKEKNTEADDASTKKQNPDFYRRRANVYRLMEVQA